MIKSRLLWYSEGTKVILWNQKFEQKEIFDSKNQILLAKKSFHDQLCWNGLVGNGLDTPSSTELEFISNIICLKNYQLAQLRVGRCLYVSEDFMNFFREKMTPCKPNQFFFCCIV